MAVKGSGVDKIAKKGIKDILCLCHQNFVPDLRGEQLLQPLSFEDRRLSCPCGVPGNDR
jgi:hypothetical protein